MQKTRRNVLLRDGWVSLFLPTFLLTGAGWISSLNGSPVWCAVCFFLAFGNLAFMAFFFRHPDRNIPLDPDLILAGADGTIRAIETLPEGNRFGEPCLRISIYLSPIDVHVNRAPIAGPVTKLGYEPGRHLLTISNKASEQNEHSSIFIGNGERRCLVKQIVGPIVRRVVHWLEEGQELAAGDPIGMMKFGSRLDTYVPESVKILITPGQKVRAGETPIAQFTSGDTP